MKVLSFLLTIVFIASCDFQKQKENVKSTEIDKIVMISKGGDGRHNLKKRLDITDENEINRLSNAFLSSKPLTRKVNVGSNYGSIVVDMVDKESESIYYLSIIYTVYDGVVIRNDLNGDKFQNDEFVGNVNNLMSNNKTILDNLKDHN
ncbi:hypothetical protein [Flagellimonas sp.]|uniref:hypothetical protein n=1 Tax=Flagellimonas sp. TaxID=2058762 RepID=UPI003B59B5AB